MPETPALAIVIPAYKPDFFRETLDSLAAQTDRRFRVYVGDDAGPPEIEAICAAATGLDLLHHRFPTNLGQSSLVAHWNRCVRLSIEPWIWLFSDDDVMSPDCVAALNAALVGLDDDDGLLRFNTEVIDHSGATIAENPRHPATESAVDFLFARLRRERQSYAVEHVFPRAAFDRAGGFAEYPVAWCSDDASWFTFTGAKRIRTLGAGRVSWRASGLNITDANTAHQREKLTAAHRFLHFVDRDVRPSDSEVSRTPGDWDAAMEGWYVGQIRYLMPLPPWLWPTVVRGSRSRWHRPGPLKVLDLTVWAVHGAWRRALGIVRRALSP